MEITPEFNRLFDEKLHEEGLTLQSYSHGMYKVLTTGGTCFIIDFTEDKIFITNSLTKGEGIIETQKIVESYDIDLIVWAIQELS